MDALFETLYFLQKDSFYKKIYYASRAYSSLVTAQILIGSQYSWNASLTSWLENLLLWLSIPTQSASSDQFVYMLGITVLVILVCVGLYYFVCHGIITGTISDHKITRCLRFLLGLLVTLSNPVLSILLTSANCDWIGGTNLSLIWDLTESCTSASRAAEITISAIAFCPFIILVILSSIMHVSDPKSSMILSRAHSRVDLLSVVADTISNALAVFLTGHDKLLAFIYITVQFSVTVCFIVFQPYFHTFTNDLFTMFSACVVWVGISFAVLTATHDDGYVASLVLYAGILPFGLLAFSLSGLWRKRVMEEALRENEVELEDGAPLADDEVFPVLRESYDRNFTTFFVEDMKAAMVELQMRFVLKSGSARSITIAENILKKGMLQFPQSVYLRLQYVSFLLHYRNDAMMASVRLDEMAGMNIDFDIQFSVLQKKREVERNRHIGHMGRGAIGMDSISFEEVKNRIKDAHGLHKKAIELMEMAWKTLARKRSGGSKRSHHHRDRSHRRVHTEPRLADMRVRVGPVDAMTDTEKAIAMAATEADMLAAVTPIIEELHAVTDKADKEYAMLWAQCGDSREVGTEYARYLRNIKRDDATAEEIEDRFQQLARDGASSTHGSSHAGSSQTGTSSHTSKELQRRQKYTKFKTAFKDRKSRLQLLLRIATFLLMLGAVCLFVVFYLLSSKSIPVFESLIEASALRTTCAVGAFQLRKMHLAAFAGDSATFNTFKQANNDTMTTARSILYGLMTVYRTDFPERNNFLSTQTIEVRRVGTDNAIVVEKLAPVDVMQMIIDNSFEALVQPMSKFRTVTGDRLLDFPQLHFVIQNHMECARAMDKETSLYIPELQTILNSAKAVIIAMCIAVGFVEFVTVVFVFRPVVNRAFEELASGMSRFARVPIETTKELAKLELAHLNRFRVLAGDEVVGGDNDLDGDDLGPAALHANFRSNHVAIGGFPSAISPKSVTDFRLNSPLGHSNTLVCSDHNEPIMAPHKPAEVSSVVTVEKATDQVSAIVSPTSKHALRKSETSRPAEMAGRAPRAKFSLQDEMFMYTKESARSEDNDGRKSEHPRRAAVIDTDGDILSPRKEDQRESIHLTSDSEDDTPPYRCQDQLKAIAAKLVVKKPRRSIPIRVPQEEQKRRLSSMDFSIDGNSDSSHNISPAPQPQREAQSEPQVPTNKKILFERILSILHVQQSRQPMPRRMFVIVMAGWVMLFAIFVCLIIVTTFGESAISSILVAAPNVNNSSRRRYLFELCILYARELYLSVDPLLSFTNTSLSMWREQDLRCLLNSTTSMALMIHYAVMYGTQFGMVDLPLGRNLATVETILSGDCSPVTRDVELFNSSAEMVGLALDPRFSDFYFIPQCATSNTFASNSIVMTDSRIYRFTKGLSSAACVHYLAGKPDATNGYHHLFDSTVTTLSRLAGADLSTNASRNAYLEKLGDILDFGNSKSDLMVGLTKVNVLSEGYAINVIYQNQNIMSGVFAVLMFVLALQYFVIGRRIEVLMQNNLSVTLTCERLLENAVLVMQKQGYTHDECKAVIKIGNDEEEAEDEEDEAAKQQLKGVRVAGFDLDNIPKVTKAKSK